ncbi:zeta toxin family protein [Nocardiopsis sediminis]|uniref:UDP-N-acetylglucosamine kinase n=1 Tax=Nocardiopsis sediminis TaxID=1778267 RepID=A0ABV8FNT9_9ACTN
MTDDSYDVDTETLKALFDSDVKDFVFGEVEASGTSSPTKTPSTVVLLGGQLAAGKSTAMRTITTRHKGIVEIQPDEFRRYHPKFKKIMAERPHDMPRLTAQAMRAWTDLCEKYAYQQGHSLVIEGTFIKAGKPLGIAERLATEPEPGTAPHKLHKGFSSEVVALAVNDMRSRIDLVGRYLAQPPGEGRWSGTEPHDLAYDNLPGTLDTLEASPAVKRIIITDRSGDHLYDNVRDPGTGDWRGDPRRASEALRSIRNEGRVPFDQSEAQQWLSSYWKHAQKLLEREELNATTAPTMLRLHQDADRVASVAYTHDPAALEQHTRWQAVQKTVFTAARRGAPNADLPRTPADFYAADTAKQTEFIAAMGTSNAIDDPGSDEGEAPSAVFLIAQPGAEESLRGSAAADRERDTGAIVHTTPQDPQATAATMRAYQDAGFRVEAVLMGVPKVGGDQETAWRDHERATTKDPELAAIGSSADRSYEDVEEIAALIDRDHLADRVRLFRRGEAAPRYENTLGSSGRWSTAPALHEALVSGRETWTEGDITDFLTKQNSMKNQRDPEVKAALGPDWPDRLADLDSRAEPAIGAGRMRTNEALRVANLMQGRASLAQKPAPPAGRKPPPEHFRDQRRDPGPELGR